MGFLDAASNIVTGYLSNKTNKRQNELARRDAASFIQTRVKDAQAAGVHPLFALGANYSPPPIIPSQQITVDGIDSGISDIRNARREAQERSRQNYETGYQKAAQIEANQLVKDQARSQMRVNEAQAQMYESEAARNRQEILARGRDTLGLSTPEQITNQVTAANPKRNLVADFNSPWGSFPGINTEGDSILENPLTFATATAYLQQLKEGGFFARLRKRGNKFVQQLEDSFKRKYRR